MEEPRARRKEKAAAGPARRGKMDEVELASNQHLLPAFPSVELKINEGIALPGLELAAGGQTRGRTGG